MERVAEVSLLDGGVTVMTAHHEILQDVEVEQQHQQQQQHHGHDDVVGGQVLVQDAANIATTPSAENALAPGEHHHNHHHIHRHHAHHQESVSTLYEASLQHVLPTVHASGPQQLHPVDSNQASHSDFQKHWELGEQQSVLESTAEQIHGQQQQQQHEDLGVSGNHASTPHQHDQNLREREAQPNNVHQHHVEPDLMYDNELQQQQLRLYLQEPASTTAPAPASTTTTTPAPTAPVASSSKGTRKLSKRKASHGRQFSNEFKLQAIRLARTKVEGGKGMGGSYGRCTAALQLGIHESYIRRWEKHEASICSELGEDHSVTILSSRAGVSYSQSRAFSPQFKLQAISLSRKIVPGGKGPKGTLGKTAAAIELGIHESYIRRWEKQEDEISEAALSTEVNRGGAAAAAAAAATSDRTQNRKRKRKNNKLTPQEEAEIASSMMEQGQTAFSSAVDSFPSQEEVVQWQ